MEQQKGAGSLSQQAVADAVDPADDAGGVHLDDAVEGVVQQGVDLGGVVLFQIDGVATRLAKFSALWTLSLPVGMYL